MEKRKRGRPRSRWNKAAPSFNWVVGGFVRNPFLQRQQKGLDSIALWAEPTKRSASEFSEFWLKQADYNEDYNRYDENNQGVLDEALTQALKFLGHDPLLLFKSARSDKRNTIDESVSNLIISYNFNSSLECFEDYSFLIAFLVSAVTAATPSPFLANRMRITP
jgi:hypothetical protein